MIDGSEKRNRQLALNFRIRMFVKSAVKPGVKTVINTYMVKLLPPFKKTLNSIFAKFQTFVCTASYCKATAHGWQLRSLPKVRTERSGQSF